MGSVIGVSADSGGVGRIEGAPCRSALLNGFAMSIPTVLVELRTVWRGCGSPRGLCSWPYAQRANCTNIAGTAFKSVLGWVGLGDYAGGVAFHQRVKRSVVSGADGSVSGRSGRLGVGNCGIKRFDG